MGNCVASHYQKRRPDNRTTVGHTVQSVQPVAAFSMDRNAPHNNHRPPLYGVLFICSIVDGEKIPKIRTFYSQEQTTRAEDALASKQTRQSRNKL